MADRDWDAEMRKIDAQMARAMAQPGPSAPVAPAAPAAPARASASPGMPSMPGLTPPDAPRTWAVYARFILAIALGVGIHFWPYAARCGVGLAAYLAAVAVVMVAGVWSAIWTWRARSGRAHVLSLLLILWGLLLAGVDVLPRVGYAVPTAAHPTGWACR